MEMDHLKMYVLFTFSIATLVYQRVETLKSSACFASRCSLILSADPGDVLHKSARGVGNDDFQQQKE